ncbi:MAG: potassium transporter [Candidatus Eisenbacteria bacterium]|uniref:Potassium transporter n=1 Tax=Eiseniibacteriota bacterium TaxID=2212470 RepID=A0A7Y2E603_UNCEI|nr:potassium transporter [Candidatus Eisenbacteria bacterium]
MHGEEFFRQALLYLAAAVIAVPIAKRLGLGSVLGYLLAGIAIGPFGFGLIGEEGQDVMHFAEFGVVMMLFIVGLELQPSLLWRMRTPILGLGGAQVSITTLAIMGIALSFGLAWQSSLAIGLTLALSSTAIVLQTLNEKGLMKSEAGQSSFAVLLFQDIAVIPMLAIFPVLAVVRPGHGTGHGDGHGSDGGHGAEAGHATPETWLESLALPGWAETLVVLGTVFAIILAGQFLLRPVLRIVASTRMRETFTAAALLIVISIALLMTKVGLSPALGTFLAGVVLANSEYRHELESDLDPFKGILLGIFFIAVGASIDFALVAGNPGMIAGIVVGLILIKLIILFILGKVFKLGLDQNLIFSFGLAQGGEFAFVLFSFANQSNVLTKDETAPLIAAVALTMALTPLLMIFNEKVLQPRFGTKRAEDREADIIDHESAVIVAGFGDFGGTVVRFLRNNGVVPVVLENDSERIELLRRMGLRSYYGDARRPELLHAAGADEAKVLLVAIANLEEAQAIIASAQKHFPHLTIYARSGSWKDAFALVKTGAKTYRHNADTALRVGQHILKGLGLRAHQLHRAANRFRVHDDEALIELAKEVTDESAYVSAARKRIESLEKVMLDEHGSVEDMDAGWDAKPLREEFADGEKPRG